MKLAVGVLESTIAVSRAGWRTEGSKTRGCAAPPGYLIQPRLPEAPAVRIKMTVVRDSETELGCGNSEPGKMSRSLGRAFVYRFPLWDSCDGRGVNAAQDSGSANGWISKPTSAFFAS